MAVVGQPAYALAEIEERVGLNAVTVRGFRGDSKWPQAIGTTDFETAKREGSSQLRLVPERGRMLMSANRHRRRPTPAVAPVWESEAGID